MNKFIYCLSLISVLILCSCNDDLFITREPIDFSVDNDVLPPDGGRACVHFKGYRNAVPAVYVYYHDDLGNEITLLQRIVDGAIDLSSEFVKAKAEYDTRSGKLVVDLINNFLAVDVYVRASREFSTNEDIVKQDAEITFLASDAARLEHFCYGELYDSKKNEYPGKTTYHFVNESYTERVFTLPQYLRPQSASFSNHISRALLLFGDAVPEVPALTVDDGKVVILDTNVPLSDQWFILPVGAAEIDEAYRTYNVPPRSLLEIVVYFSEMRYSVPFSALAVSSPSGAELPLSGYYLLKIPEVESVSSAVYPLEEEEARQ